MNLSEDLFGRAHEAPDRMALAFGDLCWTYAELVTEARRRAALLDARDVRAGDRVALILRNGPESVFSLFACWTIGAVPVLVSALYGPDDLAAAFAKTSPRLALIDDDLGDARAAAHDLPVFAAADLRAAPDPSPSFGIVPVSLRDDAESAILFTGGTTGTPKAVIATHGGTIAAMAKLAAASKGRPGPYALAPEGVSPNLVLLPLFHSGGQQALLFSFHVGRAVVLVDRFSAAATAAEVAAHRIDNLFLLPTMVFDLAYAAEAVDLSSVRSVLVAGGALDAETRAAFEKRYRIPIASNYGSTEIGHVAGWTARDIKAGLWKPGSAGRIYDGVEVEIRGPDGAALPAGEIGEICVRTALTKGYAGGDGAGEDAPGEAIHVDGWVLSGDLGHVDADGILFLAGRKRELIKCGGFQVFPGEVEDALRTSPIVADVAVVGRPDRRLGEVPKAFVVARQAERAGPEAEAALIDHVRARLAHYKAVREVEFVAVLPRTASGKIDRAALAAR